MLAMNAGWTEDQFEPVEAQDIGDAAPRTANGSVPLGAPKANAFEIATGPYQPGKVTNPVYLDGLPVPRQEWLVENFIPKGEVTLLSGDGGLGKTMLLQQLATAAAVGRDWLGLPVRSGRTFALFCEDRDAVLHARQTSINRKLELSFSDLGGQFLWKSAVDDDPAFVHFDDLHPRGSTTDFYRGMVEFVDVEGFDTVIVDTATDTFGGDEINRRQVNHFIKVVIGRLRKKGATVIVCTHPSLQGMRDGSGLSGSRHWNNAVRNRLYLSDEGAGALVLTNKKQNYGPRGAQIRLKWADGCFEAISSSIGQTAAERDAILEEAVLRAVVAHNAAPPAGADRYLHSAKGQPNFIGKVLKRSASGVVSVSDLSDIAAAVERLAHQGRLEIVKRVRDKHPMHYVATGRAVFE
jgi:hypothetical protein